MKGYISLKDFIKSAKKDIVSAIDTKSPFFYMDEVELEVSFFLDAEATVGANLLVVDISGKTKASQCHKVRIKLTPFVNEGENVPTGSQGTIKRMVNWDGSIFLLQILKKVWRRPYGRP